MGKIPFVLTLREWQNTYKYPINLIVQASVMDGSDSWQEFPIGMQYSYLHNYKKGEMLQIGSHESTVLCCFNTTTDSRRRANVLNRSCIQDNLLKNNIQNIFVPPNDYFTNLPNYKFVISPEGNGIDCYRHYEALIAGCIPIIEENPQIKEKYKGCPILFTKNYSEITAEYLLEQYEKMIDTEYDFSCLFLSYYDDTTQKYIKQCGNFWTNECVGINFYEI